MKNNLPFFSHYNSTHNEPRYQALIAEFGMAGYGRYWVLCEKIASSPGALLDLSSRVIRLTIVKALDFSSDEFDSFISFLGADDIGLVRIQGGMVTTDQIQEDYRRVTKKRLKDRDAYMDFTPAGIQS